MVCSVLSSPFAPRLSRHEDPSPKRQYLLVSGADRSLSNDGLGLGLERHFDREWAQEGVAAREIRTNVMRVEDHGSRRREHGQRRPIRGQGWGQGWDELVASEDGDQKGPGEKLKPAPT